MAEALVTRDFTPSEMAAIADVSTSLQRVWRQRGILSERKTEGWTRFTLEEVILAKVIRMSSRLGAPIEEAQCIATKACAPIFTWLFLEPGSHVIEDAAGKEFTPRRKTSKSTIRFLAVAHGHQIFTDDFDAGEFLDRISGHEDLGSLNRAIENVPASTVFDLQRIAKDIAERAGLPLFRGETDFRYEGK